MVCPANTNSEPSWDKKNGEMGARMEVCREEKKMFSVSSTQGSISLLEESTQPKESLLRRCSHATDRSYPAHNGMLEIGL